MKGIFRQYAGGADIPFRPYIKNRKIVKYYTPETMAAMATLGELFGESGIPADTPFFYSSGEMEFLDYFKEVCKSFTEEEQNIPFSGNYFVEQVMPRLSPLTQFRIMRNMCFFICSYELGLRGENALFLDSLQGLLYSVRLSAHPGPALIGAGRLHSDGAAECGFALISKQEAEDLMRFSETSTDPLVFFQQIQEGL